MKYVFAVLALIMLSGCVQNQGVDPRRGINIDIDIQKGGRPQQPCVGPSCPRPTNTTVIVSPTIVNPPRRDCPAPCPAPKPCPPPCPAPAPKPCPPPAPKPCPPPHHDHDGDRDDHKPGKK
jgi:hypothetical protein